MNMTKRDIADIVLVWMAVSFILALLTSLVTLGSIIGMPDEQTKWMTRSVAVVFQIVHLVVLLLLNYMLLFKRRAILDLVFRDGREKEVTVPAGLTALASYAFWIRLLGMFTFLSSAMGFLGHLVTDLAAKRQFAFGAFWMVQSGSQFVSAVLALGVIWKADWIAEKLKKIGASNQASHATSEPAPGADSSAREG